MIFLHLGFTLAVYLLSVKGKYIQYYHSKVKNMSKKIVVSSLTYIHIKTTIVSHNIVLPETFTHTT